jgi:hypothetical protein
MSDVHTRTPSQPERPTYQVNAPRECGDDYIRALLAQQFAGHGGGAQLARKLGISESTASVLRHGDGDLTRAAAMYGYIPDPDAAGQWLRVYRKLDPKKCGRLRWTPEHDDRIRRALASSDSLREVAVELGTTRKRILDRITRAGLRKPIVGSLDEAVQASQARLRSQAERRA